MSKPYIDHVGFVVEDLESALEMFGALWGLEPGPIKEKAEVGLRMASLEAANVTLELIQFTGAPSDFEEVLGRRPGLNHLGVRVDDMAPALKRMAEAGVAPAPGFPIQGSRGALVFNRPETAAGVLFELCEIKGA